MTSPRKMGQNRTMIAVRPDVQVLWEGVPIEELGLQESLVSVSFTHTVGRSKPSKQFVAGKPKVGGAELTFSLQDRTVARRIAALLHKSARPTLSVAFGYDGQAMYWVGAFAQGVAPDSRTYKKVGNFKMDTVRWSYGASEMPRVTLSGMSDKVIGLVEKVKPRIYTDQTLRQIFEGIADEHGLVLDLDPAVRADVRLTYVTKTSRESDWEFLTRLALRAGAAGMYVYDQEEDDPVMGFESPSAANSFSARQVGARGMDKRTNAARAKAVLRVSRLPGFIDLSQFTQERPVKIGYGGWLDPALKAQMDHLAVKVTIKEDGYKSGTVPSAASTTADNQTHNWLPIPFEDPETGEGRVLTVNTSGAPISKWAKTPQKTQVQAIRKDVPGTSLMHTVMDTLPAEIDSGKLASDQLAAVALANGITFEVEIELTPGVPYIQPPMKVELYGTDAHDGLYGVETAKNEWGEKGLVTSLTCKPVDVRVSSSDVDTPASAVSEDDLLVITFESPEGQGEELVIPTTGVPIEKWDETLLKLAKEKKLPEPVPATPEDEQ